MTGHGHQPGADVNKVTGKTWTQGAKGPNPSNVGSTAALTLKLG